MKLKAVLFDMDGTILDSAPDFIAVTQQMLERRGLPPVVEDRIKQVISGGAKAMVKAAFNLDEQDPQFDILRQEFLALYLKGCAVHSTLYTGIDELLKHLENAHIKWGVVTNKPLRFAQPIMQRLQLTERCSVLVCPEHVTRSKPSPEPMLLAAKQLAIDPSAILYVGDDQRDIESGNGAGCKTVAVSYGYVHPDDNPHNWGAGAVVTSVKQLTELIEHALCGC